MLKKNTIVSGINLVAREAAAAAGRTEPTGQIISVEQPIHYSSVSLVDPMQSEVRIQSRFLDDGTSARGERASEFASDRAETNQLLEKRRREAPG